MPRYKLTIEYDGAPFVGWQRQANGRSVQQAIEEALVRLTGESVDAARRRAHRCRRACARPGGAFRSRPRLDRRQAARRAERASPARAGRDPLGRAGRGRLRRALSRRSAATIATASLNRRAPPVLDRGRVWHVARAARCRRHARRRAAPRRHARLHHLPLHRMPGEEPGPDARPARRLHARRRDRRRGDGALLPAQPGALDGRLAEAGRRGKMERRRSRSARSTRATAPPAGRWRRRDGLYLVRVDYPGGGDSD